MVVKLHHYLKYHISRIVNGITNAGITHAILE